MSGEISLADVGKVYTVRDGSVEAVKSVTLSRSRWRVRVLARGRGVRKINITDDDCGPAPVSRREILIDNNKVTRPGRISLSCSKSQCCLFGAERLAMSHYQWKLANRLFRIIGNERFFCKAYAWRL